MVLQNQNMAGNMGPTVYERNQEGGVQLRVPGQMISVLMQCKAKSMGLLFNVVQVA